MKVAIVGCGGLGNVHASCYAEMPGVTVVGVCDIDEEQVRRTADRIGAPAYVSYRDMLEQSGCEVVSIAVPSYLHKQFSIEAAEAGKHVISEKPIALNLADAREMIDTCRNNGVRLFVGHVVRYFPEYAQMKHQLADGTIGRLGVAHTSRIGGHPGNVRAWYFDEECSGGVILDLMIHDIDFIRWAGGEVRSVYSQRATSRELDYATATLVFESGAVANLKAHWGYPGPFTTAADLAGNGGVIRTDSSRSASLQIRKTEASASGGPFVEVPQSPGYESPYYTELLDFIDCIREGREAVVTAEDAYKALEIALAAAESARTGKAVMIGQDTRKAESV
ncbi:Gfo/Idh/MocA family protein [Paenibacillus spongiae]|uniref:Gfo/Idh/MocA family oxidoreductase n=1 Tax=Paenibacillus spongiae TaxID=2909671 RepID=A0ABY5S3F1_9BACL|nr:Gfo/Idh/MocA family oxidoreductase [Paenibacillus spongiae]UVI28427.1 Gfo/Idh/MocA family oxidoreductase [Paenibacillus spongiae]